MSNEVLIDVENVSKKFCRNLKKSLWYGVKDISSELVSRKSRHGQLRSKEFWAVDDVSFQVRRGECLGLIGSNGAGKTTLLRLMNGLIKPDKGKITVRGRVGAMIALGAGFNPILTGRENVFAAGSILGLTTKKISEKYEAIVNFSELQGFMDTPVQNYSSGMRVRLGFAVATQMEVDILILDEILAVGDVGFRAKCINTIGQIVKKTAVILVSHNMPDIARIATKALVLEHGKTVMADTDVTAVMNKYYSLFLPQSGYVLDNKSAKIGRIEINGRCADIESHIFEQGSVTVSFDLEFKKLTEKAVVSIGVLKQDFQIIAQCSTLWSEKFLECKHSKYRITASLEHFFLNPGKYYLVITILDGPMRNILVQHFGTVHFQISGRWLGYSPIQLFPDWEIAPMS